MSKRSAILLTAACLAAGGAYTATRLRAKPTVVAAAQSTETVVPAARVQRADLSRDIKLTAEFKPFQDVDVMAKVAGYVKKIYVDVGDRVQQGQVLAVLEIPEMHDELTKGRAVVDRSSAEVARARDEVRRAESAHDIAHVSYTRLAAVMQQKPGLLAQQEVDDAHGRDLVAEAQVAAAKSQLDATLQAVKVSQAEQSKTETLMAYTKVVAPFAGVVVKRFADNGSMIQAGTASQTQAMPVVRIAQNSTLRLILPVPESAVSKIRAGEPLDVDVPSLGRKFRGRVARFSGEVDRSTRTMLTEVDVPNPNYVLMPGMYAEVNLSLDRRDAAVSIPLGAIDPGEQAGRVLVVTPAGTIEIRDVELGLETPDRVEVKSGLKDGEVVVTGKRSGLRPGQHVTAKIDGGRAA